MSAGEDRWIVVKSRNLDLFLHANVAYVDGFYVPEILTPDGWVRAYYDYYFIKLVDVAIHSLLRYGVAVGTVVKLRNPRIVVPKTYSDKFVDNVRKTLKSFGMIGEEGITVGSSVYLSEHYSGLSGVVREIYRDRADVELIMFGGDRVVSVPLKHLALSH